MIEFFVHERRQEANSTVVTGVVNAGTIQIGTVFVGISKESVTGAAVGYTLPARFVVTKIVAYGQEIDDLPEGMTGALAIEGDGADRLDHGHFLSST